MTRLLELRLRNFAVVRDARLDCDPGFGALSGETGAGKSLCIAAVRWALGARVEGEAVGEGTSVRAVFEPSSESVVVLAGLGIPVDDLVTLTRDAGSSGRSTCRVNGALVSPVSYTHLDVYKRQAGGRRRRADHGEAARAGARGRRAPGLPPRGPADARPASRRRAGDRPGRDPVLMSALISVQLRVSSASRSVTHVSALPPSAARFLELTGLSAAISPFRP